ncbi:MAG: hypothetical protein L0H26_04315, partial [Microlunatus sp.]|nr:hypothetical protein [Microlunatus sp.]
GLRDVLDSPSVTFSEWRAAGISETVRDLYDQVWVYGDPGVYDAASAYGWSWPVRSKMIYTGYLAHGRSRSAESHRPRAADPAPPVDPYVLCLVGGGQDGGQLAEAFLAADQPVRPRGVLRTGPYLPPDRREQLDRMVSRRPEMSIHRFVSRAEEFIGSAAATVTMGGYNSVCESLAAGGPTLVVPRVVPRVEQVMRADALSRAGWLDVLLPAELSSRRIGGWLAAAVIGGRRPRRPIDLDGLARVPRLVDGLLERSSEVVHAVG